LRGALEKIALAVIVFLFLVKVVYVKEKIDSPEDLYRMLNVPKGEELIAAYHQGYLWQFATYDPKSNFLKVYTLDWSPYDLDPNRRVESARAFVNYSPLAMNISVLRAYRPHKKALLFKTLGWKYNAEINGSYLPYLGDILKPGVPYYSISGVVTNGRFWVRPRNICSNPSIFAFDIVCYGSIGSGGLLTLPGYQPGRMVWIVSRPFGNKAVVWVHYPKIVLSKEVKDKNVNFSIFTRGSLKPLASFVPEYVARDALYLGVSVEEANDGSVKLEANFVISDHYYGHISKLWNGSSREVDS
jgi:hypothetical protein